MQRTFEESLALGLENEEAVILLPKLKSWFKTPLSRIDNGRFGMGPRMIGPDGRRLALGIIVPDYDLTHPMCEPCALEMKWKADSSFTRITGEEEHGIGHNLYMNYLAWQFMNRRQVVLMITENSRGEILAATLSRLQKGLWTDLRHSQKFYRPRYSESNGMGKMAFFGRDQFSVFEQTEPLDLPLFKKEKVPPTQGQVSHLHEIVRAETPADAFWQP